MKTFSITFGLALVLTGLLQTAALAWMVLDRVQLLRTGTEIVLDTRPVDPRSLFRGHYVILNYEISTLDLQNLPGSKTFRSGDHVDVLIERQDTGTWDPASVHSAGSVVSPPDGQVLLRGRVRHCHRSDHSDSECAKITVRYGAEKYFVYKDRALELERVRDKRRLRIILAVSEDGEAAVKGIEDGGRRIYNEPLF
ncbi:MAG: GDYXXLXY domain-containing protein [Pseudomonadota bacterium]